MTCRRASSSPQMRVARYKHALKRAPPVPILSPEQEAIQLSATGSRICLRTLRSSKLSVAVETPPNLPLLPASPLTVVSLARHRRSCRCRCPRRRPLHTAPALHSARRHCRTPGKDATAWLLEQGGRICSHGPNLAQLRHVNIRQSEWNHAPRRMFRSVGPVGAGLFRISIVAPNRACRRRCAAARLATQDSGCRISRNFRSPLAN